MIRYSLLHFLNELVCSQWAIRGAGLAKFFIFRGRLISAEIADALVVFWRWCSELTS